MQHKHSTAKGVRAAWAPQTLETKPQVPFRTTPTTQETFLVVESKLKNRTGMIQAKEEGSLKVGEGSRGDFKMLKFKTTVLSTHRKPQRGRSNAI